MRKPPTTLITGASSGIGEELARVFAKHGHDLILAARRRDRLEALAKELRDRHKVEAHVFVADLALDNGAAALHTAVTEAGYEVGILVNNAGVLAEGKFLDIDLEKHCQILDVNARALMQLTHLFGRDMRRRKQGRILNVCSISGFQPLPNLASYAATKAYVLSLSESLAIENAAHGITVTALCPGFVKTDMIDKGESDHMKAPLVRTLSAEEVAVQGYDATMAGKTVYINGVGNRLVQAFTQYQPRWMRRRVLELMERQKY